MDVTDGLHRIEGVVRNALDRSRSPVKLLDDAGERIRHPNQGKVLPLNGVLRFFGGEGRVE